jgi:hypothetical protein
MIKERAWRAFRRSFIFESNWSVHSWRKGIPEKTGEEKKLDVEAPLYEVTLKW